MLSSKTPTELLFGDSSIKSSIKETLFVSLIFIKVIEKINALGRIANFMSHGKRHLIMKTLDYDSQFNYCALIWMIHSRILNNKTNRLHERALRID